MRFFRKYMREIVLFMIGCFVLTIGAGLGLSGINRMNGRGSNAPTENQVPVAKVGSLIVPQSRFQERYQRVLSKYSKDLPIESIEALREDSFDQSVRFTVLLEEAKKHKIKVRGGDERKFLNTMAVNSGLRSRGEVKKAVIKQGGNWSEFLVKVDDDLRVNKFIQALRESIKIKQQEIDDYFTEVKARHILIKFDANVYTVPAVAQAEEAKVKTALTELRQQITAGGISFADAAKKYSQDMGSQKDGGELGYFGRGVMDPDFEHVAFALTAGELSPLVKSAYGYHIILVEDKRQGNRPPDVTDDQIRSKLIASQHQKMMDAVVAGYFNQPLEVDDIWIKAIRAKLKGQDDMALLNYQILQGQASFSPVPHYLTAQIYFKQKKYDLAEAELKKADLKQTFLKNDVVYPEIWVLMGDVYREEKKSKEALDQYALASSKAPNRLDIHKLLAKIYKDLKLKAKQSDEEVLVAKLEATIAKPQAGQAALGQPTPQQPVRAVGGDE